MKSFLVNLLIVVCLGLCAFNAVQWQRETRLHLELRQLGTDLQRRSGEIQNLQQTLKVHEDDIRRLDALREALLGTNRFLRTEVNRHADEATRFRREAQIQEAKANQVEPLRKAFEEANNRVKQANETILSQNDKMRQLGEERNQFATRINEMNSRYTSLGAEYEKLLGLYTNLVAQVEAANARNARK